MRRKTWKVRGSWRMDGLHYTGGPGEGLPCELRVEGWESTQAERPAGPKALRWEGRSHVRGWERVAELGWRGARDAGHGGQQSTRGPAGILFSEREEGFHTRRHHGHSDRGETLCWVPGGWGGTLGG